jgi:hypothetical protein
MSAHPQPEGHGHKAFWLWVMCLTGVDYFSTLGYQPSIAFEATGLLAPLATVLLVAVTLGGALPVYAYVAGKSPHGQGSIGMLERLVHGWTGKFLVLALLGFAATDFVITKTLSAADAAEHLIANPFWPVKPDHVDEHKQQLFATFFLLVLLGATFLRGFREVIGLAVVIVAVYLALNGVIIGSALAYLAGHPGELAEWYEALGRGPEAWHIHEALPVSGQGWGMVALVCLILFPKLALGLSGFETGVAVMPLVRGRDGEAPPAEDKRARAAAEAEELAGRVRNTRKLLVTAAVVMSVLLLGSSLVVSTLIEPQALVGPLTEEQVAQGLRKPPAKDRALAYLAHGEGGTSRVSPLFGHALGTVYDVSTIVILWFAGASAMAGLMNLVPQYLPRYGMAPDWARAVRPLAVLFTAINLFVTWVFDASVTKQGGAYATGVLVLITSACVATVISRWRERAGPWPVRVPWGYALITAAFVYTTVAVVIEKPDGIKIAGCFIGGVLVSSVVSRTVRSTELRFQGFEFKDDQSRFLWDSMKHLEFPVLVPHRPGRRDLASKEESIRAEHRLGPEVFVVFIEVELGDVSEFYQRPVMEVFQEQGRFVLRVTRANSIANTIAALALELSKVGKPPEIHFGWSDESPLAANIDFVLFGEGNVPWLVRELILKAEPHPERQPRVIIG